MQKIKKIPPILAVMILLGGSCTSTPVKPDGATQLILTSVDRHTPSHLQEGPIFYKIFVNEELAAQTPAGNPQNQKNTTLKLKPGRYWFYMERWLLATQGNSPEEFSGEYHRANNVWQMKTHIEVIIPEGRQLTGEFGFDHQTKKFYFEIQ